MKAPSFSSLLECLGSKLPNFLRLVRRNNKLFAGYVNAPAYLVESSGSVTPGGVMLLARTASRGVVRVKDEKRAMMFLYGRDLFKESVVMVKRPCKEGYVLVYWGSVLLGLGKMHRGLVLNVVDFGEFLRRGY